MAEGTRFKILEENQRRNEDQIVALQASMQSVTEQLVTLASTVNKQFEALQLSIGRREMGDMDPGTSNADCSLEGSRRVISNQDIVEAFHMDPPPPGLERGHREQVLVNAMFHLQSIFQRVTKNTDGNVDADAMVEEANKFIEDLVLEHRLVEYPIPAQIDKPSPPRRKRSRSKRSRRMAPSLPSDDSFPPASYMSHQVEPVAGCPCPPLRKRSRRMAPSDGQTMPSRLPLIPFFPDEISIRCIARVPVTSHTVLAQVSRSWRSFVRSASFFSIRSELAVTELVLTISIKSDSEVRRQWFHLHPYQTPFPLPLPQEQEYDYGFACASLGPHLFCIGGVSSPNSVQIYDGCLHRWSHGPPTSTPREFATAGVAGDRIHVIGGCKNSSFFPLAESLAPAGPWWDPVPPIPAHLLGSWWRRNYVIDGKLLFDSKRGSKMFGAAFDPNIADWAHAPPWWMDDVSLGPLAVVGGVPYVFRHRILGYGNDGQWRPVEGESVTELLNHMCEVTLLTFGGLLCLKGEEMELRDGFVMRIFAGIDISRTSDGGFRGSIMWLDSSLKLSEEETLDQCVVLEL